MCGRVIQSSAAIRLAIVDGLNVQRFHNYPPHWNGAPSQELLVIRRNRQTGAVSIDPLRLGSHSLLLRGPEGRAQTYQRHVREYSNLADLPRCLSPPSLHRAG
jgi:putative SOS response-associated peptidase YedK